MTKIEIKILRGSAVTQNVLGGSIIYRFFCKFPAVCVCQNEENQSAYLTVMNHTKRTPCNCISYIIETYEI